MLPDPLAEMKTSLQKAETARDTRTDGTYDAEIGYVGDETEGILTAYVPNEFKASIKRDATDLGLTIVPSHEVPETNETVIAFELGTDATAT